jgi:cell division transport system permease protein
MKKRRTNYFYSIISVALVLFLLGFCGTVLLFVRQKAMEHQEGVKMMVEIKDGADSTALADLKAELPNAPFLKKETFEFVTREKIFKEMKEWFGETLINDDMPMPFADAYRFSLKDNYAIADSIEAISTRLKGNLAVNDAFVNETLNREANKTLENIAWFALAVAGLFIIVAITLIHNTIRLNLYSDRFIIKNMELVGASWGFITRPYIRKGLRNGLLSALLALAGIAIIWYFVQKNMPEMNRLLKSPVFLGSVGGLLLLGILISWLSTFYVVNKYLKMRIDDLY